MHHKKSDGLVAVRPVDSASSAELRMKGKLRTIFVASMVMIIPMVLFSALLLGLTFHYRVVRNDFASDNLAFSTSHDSSSAIYVRLASTTLITVASWSSTLAPILVGFAITLISFPAAGSILEASRKERSDQLLTPYQLSLVLQMISNASVASCWSWIQYTLGRKQRQRRQAKAIKMMAVVLILGIFLSVLILVTDTWLHFTTKSVLFTNVGKGDYNSTHGFNLKETCRNIAATYSGECTLNKAAAGAFLIDGFDALEVLNNRSDIKSAKVFERNGRQIAYLGNQDSSQVSKVDYTANTVATYTQCKPVTSSCINPKSISGTTVPWKCLFAFQGTLAVGVGLDYQSMLRMAYFTDSSGSNNSTATTNLKNPYYFAALLHLNRNIGRKPSLTNDPEIQSSTHGATLVAVFCNTTVLDVEYSSVNGTITRFVVKPSNSSTTNIIQGSQQHTQVGDPTLLQAASIAGMGDTADGVAADFALSYSRTVIGVAAPAYVPVPALESQERESIIVARVPKAPLICLVIANLLLAALAIILTVLALLARGNDVYEVQSRLSIPNLVAALFAEERATQAVAKVEDLLDEKAEGARQTKIEVTQSAENGWVFRNRESEQH